MAAVFKRPATTFVAEFVGMKNVLPAHINDNRLHIGELTLPAPSTSSDIRLAMIRPEHVRLTPMPQHRKASTENAGRIASISNQGIFAELAVDAAGVRFVSVMLSGTLLEMDLQPGRPVSLTIDPADIHLI